MRDRPRLEISIEQLDNFGTPVADGTDDFELALLGEARQAGIKGLDPLDALGDVVVVGIGSGSGAPAVACSRT